eukprot:1555275-Pleurochrysis_carterae.AAC.2
MMTLLVGGADLNGTTSSDPADLRFDRPYRASPTGLMTHKGLILLSGGAIYYLRVAQVCNSGNSNILQLEWKPSTFPAYVPMVVPSSMYSMTRFTTPPN